MLKGAKSPIDFLVARVIQGAKSTIDFLVDRVIQGAKSPIDYSWLETPHARTCRVLAGACRRVAAPYMNLPTPLRMSDFL